MTTLPDLDRVVARLHAAWMASKTAAGIDSERLPSGVELIRPWDELGEEAREHCRSCVRPVFDAIRAELPEQRERLATFADLSFMPDRREPHIGDAVAWVDFPKSGYRVEIRRKLTGEMGFLLLILVHGHRKSDVSPEEIDRLLKIIGSIPAHGPARWTEGPQP